MESLARSRSRRRITRDTPPICSICQKVLSSYRHLDVDSQEQAIFRHMIQCSAARAAGGTSTQNEERVSGRTMCGMEPGGRAREESEISPPRPTVASLNKKPAVKKVTSKKLASSSTSSTVPFPRQKRASGAEETNGMEMLQLQEAPGKPHLADTLAPLNQNFSGFNEKKWVSVAASAPRSSRQPAGTAGIVGRTERDMAERQERQCEARKDPPGRDAMTEWQKVTAGVAHKKKRASCSSSATSTTGTITTATSVRSIRDASCTSTISRRVNAWEEKQLDPGHFLNQTWWRKPKKRRRNDTGIPFDIRQCMKEEDWSVNPSVQDSELPATPPLTKSQLSDIHGNKNLQAADIEPASQNSSRRLRSRPSKGVDLKLSCPYCGREFKSYAGMPPTEETMSRHVTKCSKKYSLADALEKVLPKTSSTLSATTDARQALAMSADSAAEIAERRKSLEIFLHGEGKRALREMCLYGPPHH